MITTPHGDHCAMDHPAFSPPRRRALATCEEFRIKVREHGDLHDDRVLPLDD
jgi:hypothetical protein